MSSRKFDPPILLDSVLMDLNPFGTEITLMGTDDEEVLVMQGGRVAESLGQLRSAVMAGDRLSRWTYYAAGPLAGHWALEFIRQGGAPYPLMIARGKP